MGRRQTSWLFGRNTPGNIKAAQELTLQDLLVFFSHQNLILYINSERAFLPRIMHIEVCRDKNPKMREQKKRVHLSSRIRGATLYQFEISQQHPSEVWFWNHFHFNITPYNNTKYRHALWTPGTWHHWFAVHVRWCIKLMLSQILASNNVCVSFVLFVYGCRITDL